VLFVVALILIIALDSTLRLVSARFGGKSAASA
jgi:hypothetical protein